MLGDKLSKVYQYFMGGRQETLSMISSATGQAPSTVHYHEQKHVRRTASSGTDQWDTPWGQDFLKRMIVSVVYTFGIKGGVGSERISEHLGHLQIEGVAAVSESTIYRLANEVSASILWYKQLQEQGLKAEAKQTLGELKVVLGLDETWLDEMLLICQDLTSGYLFLKRRVQSEQAKPGGRI